MHTNDRTSRRRGARPRVPRAALPALLAVLAVPCAGGLGMAAEEGGGFLVQSRAVGTRPESEPPRYARRLDETGLEPLADVDWLILGVDHRTRFEYRDDDYRRGFLTDRPFLLRTRAYLGVERILDPLRFGVELQDSRLANSSFPDNTRDVDELDFLQGWVELHLADLLGPGRPVRLQGGRLAFEYLDRRLISRNPWRNTTNAFQGGRLMLGDKQGDWWVDALGVQPVEIRPHQPDRRGGDRWFYGVIGSWQRWSKIVTLQPYVLVLDERREDAEPRDREIYTLGLRSFGVLGTPGFDYDVNLAGQLGDDGPRRHRAFGGAGELGYQFGHPWKPRASAFLGYASGDGDPEDGRSGRLDRLFGFARPWSASDYFIWENLIAPKTRVELAPTATVRVEAGYGAYWLASDSDAWPNAGLRDETGKSGAFVGHEIDGRIRWAADPRVEVVLGYAHFEPGGFSRRTSAGHASEFAYLEVTLQLFGEPEKPAGEAKRL